MRVIVRKRVYHVGTMDVSRKNKFSHEGTGLSVSMHPDAWRQISETTSGRTWRLSKPSGGRFCEATSLSQKDKELIANWGDEQGYVVVRQLYNVYSYDDELECEVFSCYESKAEAETEANEGDRIETCMGLTPCDRMCNSLGWTPPLLLVPDLLLTLWAEASGFDGVWWNEELAPERLSAPRGVIFNSRLKEWTAIPN